MFSMHLFARAMYQHWLINATAVTAMTALAIRMSTELIESSLLDSLGYDAVVKFLLKALCDE